MALREINLVDADILIGQQMRRHLLFWAGSLVIALLLMGGFSLYRLRAVGNKRSDPAAVARVSGSLNARVGELGQVQKELENLRQRESIIESLTRKQPAYRVLVKLSDIMNPYVWIADFDLDRGKDNTGGSRIRLTGFSRSNERLGDFLNRLWQDPLFTAVELKFSRETGRAQPAPASGNSAGQVQFQIECNVSEG